MSDGAGLYVHVPFCLTRCGYCDFNTYAGLEHLRDGYAHALMREARLLAGAWADAEFVSLFLGGGTPTTLPVEVLVALLREFRSQFRFVDAAEVTVEANPDTIDAAYLRALVDAGMNRLSVGVQSFDPAVLAALERIHSPDSARAAFVAARGAGLTNVNLDLIYGADGETLDSWGETLEQAIALAPEHLSCYALTIEPATSLGRQVAAGLIPSPDPDLQADMYFLACELLARAGYEHYEVSNWAYADHRSVHNLGYWEGRPYLGLGAGAHSFRDGVRWWNVRTPARYIAMALRGDRPVGGEEQLGEDERALERLLLGLRIREGVARAVVDPERAGEFVRVGVAEWRAGRFALTERGLFLANEVVAGLVAERSNGRGQGTDLGVGAAS